MAEADKLIPQKAKGFLALSAVFVTAIALSGAVYFRGLDNTYEASAQAIKERPYIPPEELMRKQPLPDIVVGKASAPVTVVEYASMTCPHCAEFANHVFPAFKKKYIDTGKIKLIFREFPLDILAARASMLARCTGPDHYMAMVEALFHTQDYWAVDGSDALKRMADIGRQAGFSQARFNKCMANKTLYDNIVKERARAANEYGVDSTPTFFIDGTRLGPAHELVNFEAAFAKDKNFPHSKADAKKSADQNAQKQ